MATSIAATGTGGMVTGTHVCGDSTKDCRPFLRANLIISRGAQAAGTPVQRGHIELEA